MEQKSNEYKTKQREAILEYIVENKEKHITADEIITRFSKQDNPIGKSTVYRYLDKLCKENIIRRFTIDGSSSACYQYGRMVIVVMNIIILNVKNAVNCFMLDVS